jgi:hypothetical protein
MGWRNDQCRKVCRIIDNFLANRPTERDSLIVAVQKAFEALEQPETNCSEIPNNSDTISRQAAKDIFTELYGISAIGSVFDKYEWADICETTANELPSAEPDIIRCKDCKHYKYGICMKIGANKSFYGFCDWADRGEQNE